MPNDADTMIEDVFAGLTEPQSEAVAHTDGPLLVLAGPGSGKTRVITRRAVHLARTTTRPSHILAITFTNKAAKEMQERIRALGVAGGMRICTFHAFCARLLREHHERASITPNYTILDRDDRRKVLKKAIEACDLSAANWRPAAVERVIGDAKNEMQTAEAFAGEDLDWRHATIARVYACYEQILAENASLDFDDLLMRVALLLQKDPELRNLLEERYRYVLIDEYQDTNAAQYTIARLLTGKRENICATGDPDQSIYGWRGANIENILRFEHDYPGAKVVRLEQNYRSTKRILLAADTLIGQNVNRKQKSLWTANDEGPAVRIVECESGEEEATMIAGDIQKQLAGGVNSRDIAIFYRVNSLSRVLEEALMRELVKYQIARGVEFYRRKEIKDVLAYLRVLVNPADEVSLLRIVNTPPRGIGETTVKRLLDRANSDARRLIDLVTSGEGLSDLGRTATKVGEFGELLKGLLPALEQPAPQALEFVLSHSGLRAMYGNTSDPDNAPAANLDELVSAASTFQEGSPEATVVDWLEHAALVSDVDTVNSAGGAVTLMTLHAAKGLEFPVVYMVGLEEGLLPLQRQDETVDDEEERRLCFVGMTRAQQRLTLSRARYRMRRGVTERTILSPFLDELRGDPVQWIEFNSPTSKPKRAGRNGTVPHDIAEWTVGTLVRHRAHGLGQILSLRRGNKQTHVEVRFQSGSQRSLVVEYAPLERVDFDDVG